MSNFKREISKPFEQYSILLIPRTGEVATQMMGYGHTHMKFYDKTVIIETFRSLRIQFSQALRRLCEIMNIRAKQLTKSKTAVSVGLRFNSDFT